MIRFFFIVLILVSPFQNLFAQQTDSTQVDLVDVLFGGQKTKKTDQERTDKKVYFSFFPAPINTPGGGRTVITSVNAAFYLGDAQTTNLSNIYFIPYTDLSTRFGIIMKPNLWINYNKWNFTGDYRLAHFPQYTWGLGGNTKDFDQTLIDTDFIRIYQNALRKIGDGWYAGAGYALDYHYNINESEILREGHLASYQIPLTDPSISSGFTMNISYDKRINAINPPRGGYLIATWRVNTKTLGSDHDYQSLFIDGRKYIPFSSSKVNLLALRSYYWTILNGDVPYLHLPSTNWAPASGIASRGFQSGRYRSNAMLYGEAEHRYQLTSNGLIGMVIFMNVASASEFNTQHFKYWKMGVGTGIRAKLNKYSNSNLAIDLAFSDNFWSVWLNVGEMF